MSDTLNKIQESASTDLPGGQQPLSPDAAAGRVRGTDVNQNSMASAIGRGAEIPASSQTSARGYSVSGVSVGITPTDRKTIEGSTPGDCRAHPGDVAAASLNAASGSNKPPRGAVQQTKLSGHTPQAAPVANSLTPDVGD